MVKMNIGYVLTIIISLYTILFKLKYVCLYYCFQWHIGLKCRVRFNETIYFGMKLIWHNTPTKEEPGTSFKIKKYANLPKSATPICVSSGPIVRSFTSCFMKFLIISKFSSFMLPDESTTNTMSLLSQWTAGGTFERIKENELIWNETTLVEYHYALNLVKCYS